MCGQSFLEGTDAAEAGIGGLGAAQAPLNGLAAESDSFGSFLRSAAGADINTNFRYAFTNAAVENLRAAGAVGAGVLATAQIANQFATNGVNAQSLTNSSAIVAKTAVGWLGAEAGATVGAQGGAAIGFAIGTVVPVVGNVAGAAIGAAVGGVVGGVAGYFGGSWATQETINIGNKVLNSF